MIAKEYQSLLESKMGRAQYLLLMLLISSLQLLKQVKLETLAEALPLPILFESRRKKLQRFLKLEILSIEHLWFPCLKQLLHHQERWRLQGVGYLALDRTQWGSMNLLMVSVIYQHRAIPIYWRFLDKNGSSNLEEQKQVLQPVLDLLSGSKLVVLGDREFCSVKLGKWLQKEEAYFCLRQKQDTFVAQEGEVYQEMRTLGLTPGTRLFLNDVEVTKQSGFGHFNLACKWKRTYRGFRTKEPWFILTNLPDLDTAIRAYQRRFGIEEMFRDFKSGGYHLEGSKLSAQALSKLLIVVAIAYTSATLQGQTIKQIGLQKYVARPETPAQNQRRHSSFYLGQRVHSWLRLYEKLQLMIQELLQISRHRLQDYLRGQRAIERILSTL